MKNNQIGLLTILIMVLFLFINSKNLDIDNIEFVGIKLSDTEYNQDIKKDNNHYNVVYSPFLPAGGIYSIIDKSTGKEAIVEIGLAKVNNNPYLLYLPEALYLFFDQENSNKKLIFKIKFLAWNREGEEPLDFNIQSLLVKPENSIDEIKGNGNDQFYIQLGAFSYYQNSYPIIYKMMPSLKVVPHFYILKKDKTDDGEIYKILAGPYSLKTAKEIAKKIYKKKKQTVIIQSGEKLIDHYKK